MRFWNYCRTEQVNEIYEYMARFLNKALFPPLKTCACFLPPKHVGRNPIECLWDGTNVFLCTMINGARMHYLRLFGFKASSVQRYFFLNDLISCCRYSESQTDFGGLASTESEFAESTIKYHPNCRAEFTNKRDLQTNHKPSDDAATGTAPRIRSHRDGNQPNSSILPDQWLFCKSQSTSQTRRPERSFTMFKNFVRTRQ